MVTAVRERTKMVAAALAMVAAGVLAGGCHRSDEGRDGKSGSSQASDPLAVGVTECDDYVSKVKLCIADHAPSDKRQALEENLARTRATWKALASNPGVRPGLGQACQLALQSAQATMKAYACVW